MPAGTPEPILIVDPLLTIATEDWAVAADEVMLIPEPTSGDISTFRNPGGEDEAYTRWRFKASMKMSYGTDSTWTDLSALGGTVVTVEVAPQNAAISVSNPKATVTFKMPTIPFINAALGSPTEFDIEAVCRAAPTVVTA